MDAHVLVFCTLRFKALHRWPNAPDWCEYLKNVHRHEFHVKCWARIDSSRQIEFIQLKSDITRWVRSEFEDCLLDASCEELAYEIMNKFNLEQVEVSEDGENGALVSRMYG